RRCQQPARSRRSLRHHDTHAWRRSDIRVRRSRATIQLTNPSGAYGLIKITANRVASTGRCAEASTTGMSPSLGCASQVCKTRLGPPEAVTSPRAERFPPIVVDFADERNRTNAGSPSQRPLGNRSRAAFCYVRYDKSLLRAKWRDTTHRVACLWCCKTYLQ